MRGFAECRPLCRVPFVGHSAKQALPRVALGKVRLSETSLFTECWTLGTGQHSAKTRLPSVKHSAKVALGKGPSAAVLKLTAVSLCREPRFGTRQRVFFAECQILGTRQITLCRVSSLDTTTGIRGFAECWILYRVPFVGHSAKKALLRAALGKVRLSAKRPFTECWTLGRGQHSAKTGLPSVKHSAKGALGKKPSAAVPKLTAVSLCRVPTVGSRQRGFFAECHIVDTRQRKLCRVSSLDTRQSIFLFFLILSPKLFVVCSYTM
jgi:hypothetical protein